VLADGVGEHDDIVNEDDDEGEAIVQDRSHDALEVGREELESVGRTLPTVANRGPGEGELVLVGVLDVELCVTLTKVQAGGNCETADLLKEIGDSGDRIVVIGEDLVQGTSVHANTDSGLVAEQVLLRSDGQRQVPLRGWVGTTDAVRVQPSLDLVRHGLLECAWDGVLSAEDRLLVFSEDLDLRTRMGAE